jgi:asparagine synthase (glutamine-hydrolysing)
MVHNGEIYNQRTSFSGILKGHTFRTQSDSRVIVHLYEEFGFDFVINWTAILLLSVDGDNYMAARDPLGVKPYIMVWMNEEEFILPPK